MHLFFIFVSAVYADDGCSDAVTAVTLNQVPLPAASSWSTSDGGPGGTPKLVIKHLGLDFFDVGDAELCIQLDTRSSCPYWGAFCHYSQGKCVYRCAA